MRSKKKHIRYLEEDLNKGNSPFNKLKYSTTTIETNSVKRYFNTINLLSRLNKSDRLLLDYLVEEMDANNLVANNAKTRKGFNLLLDVARIEPYSDSTVHKSFSRLVKGECLIRLKSRSVFRVNPLYFFRGTEEERIKMIRENLEEPIRIKAANYRKNYFRNKKISDLI